MLTQAFAGLSELIWGQKRLYGHMHPPPLFTNFVSHRRKIYSLLNDPVFLFANQIFRPSDGPVRYILTKEQISIVIKDPTVSDDVSRYS